MCKIQVLFHVGQEAPDYHEGGFASGGVGRSVVPGGAISHTLTPGTNDSHSVNH